MFNPGSTYRIQFRKEFNFDNFDEIADYIVKLGITTLYASPIFSATPASTHGYDVTDANTINTEIGSLEQLKEISKQLHDKGVGWLQDIVPNHMAYHYSNKWLMDVLEKGQESIYAQWFDIDWHHPDFSGKLMLPVLTILLEQAIDEKKIQIAIVGNKPMLKYNDIPYPLNVQSIPAASTSLEEWINQVNNDPAALRQVLDKQHYQFCHWSETNNLINYRRFFTISGMICLNMQHKDAFNDYHTLIKNLIAQKLIDGLRVDHIDGLYDPTEYLLRLRQLAGSEMYITVEKILEPGEQLPAYWPVQGTTGYDFIASINNLFSSNKGIIKLKQFYQNVIGGSTSYDTELLKKKSLILKHYMQGELDNLYRQMQSTIHYSIEGSSAERMETALALFLVYCPVYRYYSNSWPLDETEKKEIKGIFQKIKDNEPDYISEIATLEQLFTSNEANNANAQEIAAFFKRCMQFTGPLMAKGVEDTLLYTYTGYIGRNEVGDSPDAIISTVGEFHKAMIERQQLWPMTMNATATHDTKRGEDARTRLHALTNMADEWIEMVKQWRGLNGEHKHQEAPTDNDEYFIYQALISSYPMPGQDVDNFEDRFKDYIKKALREAKINTNWDKPNENYESAVISFIEHLLKPGGAFMTNFLQKHKQAADGGIVISLSQLVLKCTCPGIPDIYQGCELWDLSMVDPDNRRPVDYEIRKKWLNEIIDSKDITSLWQERYNGKIKLWLLHKLLSERKNSRQLFEQGKYIPLKAGGRHGANIICYARVYEHNWCVVIAVINNIVPSDWDDTYIFLPADAPVSLKDMVTEEIIRPSGLLYIKDVMRNLPFAILKGTAKENKRAAGILLPVFSLPGEYGIGDMGNEAQLFADILHECKQKYWQILPLNPANAANKYSPYSSLSAMAGNPLLISPELLAIDGLISEETLKAYQISNTGQVDYAHAERIKIELLDKAYQTFCQKTFTNLRYAFETYCEQENYWLHDFALYMAFKQKYSDMAWYDWPCEHRLRDQQALEEFSATHKAELQKTKWVQFITDHQWKRLREYCNGKGIKIFGDLPFYVSYDSVDVWANTDIFTLDHDGKMTGVAGVPPDYFSEDGQLWGVPTFNWQKIKESGYKWWIKRLKRNIELFDVVRIDHFRALEAYWEVPAGEQTARNGTWIKGPGMEFFDVLKKELPKLPLIAEDLGYEMDDVYALREQSGLHGMKVLQFAWGDNMSTSVDIPHNYPVNCIAYTGTHDNNTTLGWYKNETSEADKKRIEEYTGLDVSERNIADIMCRMAYASVADTAILPIQDILGLDERFRMNTPGTTINNWLWRLTADAVTPQTKAYLTRLVKLYNRS